jgi:hypothetical protein
MSDLPNLRTSLEWQKLDFSLFQDETNYQIISNKNGIYSFCYAKKSEIPTDPDERTEFLNQRKAPVLAEQIVHFAPQSDREFWFRASDGSDAFTELSFVVVNESSLSSEAGNIYLYSTHDISELQYFFYDSDVPSPVGSRLNNLSWDVLDPVPTTLVPPRQGDIIVDASGNRAEIVKVDIPSQTFSLMTTYLYKALDDAMINDWEPNIIVETLECYRYAGNIYRANKSTTTGDTFDLKDFVLISEGINIGLLKGGSPTQEIDNIVKGGNPFFNGSAVFKDFKELIN